MEQIDVRRLDVGAREQLRRMVVRMHKQGRTMTSIATESCAGPESRRTPV